ncbi:arginine N-methyltransferase (macronuclear) [Tetrahymena thermophila SB210]|uniref:type I protein arginine methyltransferase n=1 Tax=Tetrahymena thermophila (strain SB210) TaxID=312017 RepID=I7MKV3_TETTS|nr:arginine N-methyltransferase [Tetrahymena thermophila SB210]EAS00376.1 arginine N-methyltransferase [Tetrahymena thermophila SB210]|eukprot:XP_001020621.1 arginine N-methyltransferase [Tetrahymena thermophila SB210]
MDQKNSENNQMQIEEENSSQKINYYHNHDVNQKLDCLEGYMHNHRSQYCKMCKRTSKDIGNNHNNFNLDTCFDNDNIKEESKGYERNQDYYYDSYSHFNIHEDMLKDKVRTKAYMKSILDNKNLFEGKIVLDIGCGTGILSIFAAKAGAKHVYGVDNANIILHAKAIVKNNNLADKITLIQGKMEEVELPVEKVDIIISEWMGYFLLYESMLDCVLDARDKYLASDGLMFPNKATMFISSFCNDEIYNQRFDFWDKVYGVDMSCMKQWVYKEPLVDQADRGTINGDFVKLIEFDLETVKKTDLDFVAEYTLKIRRDDYVQGVIIWWDVYFNYCKIPIKLSTSPFASETHWKQTMFFIENEDIPVIKGDTLSGKVAVKKCTKNPRDLDIKIQFKLENREIDFDKSFVYKMN